MREIAVSVKGKINKSSISSPALTTVCLHSSQCNEWRQSVLSSLLRGAGWPDLYPKWVKLTPNGTNPGIFQIRFSTFGSVEPNVLNLIWKKSPDLSHLGQFDPLWGQNWPPSLVWQWNCMCWYLSWRILFRNVTGLWMSDRLLLLFSLGSFQAKYRSQRSGKIQQIS